VSGQAGGIEGPGSGSHCVEDLPALLNGELALPELRATTRHLRSCAACQQELVEIAAGMGALSHAERQGLIDSAPLVLPPLADVVVADAAEAMQPTSLPVASEKRRRRWALPVAAAFLVALVAGAALLGRDSSTKQSPTAQAPLIAVGSQPARGTVAMAGTGASRTMVVSTDLTPTKAGSFYEVWLLDTRTNGMVAVGVLPASGSARFTLPSNLLAGYNAVDISLQPDNGVPVHSADSVLRANYA
jgi:hypothetical protein